MSDTDKQDAASVTLDGRTTVNVVVMGGVVAAVVTMALSVGDYRSKVAELDKRLAAAEALSLQHGEQFHSLDKRAATLEAALPALNKRLDDLSLEVRSSKAEVIIAINNLSGRK